MAGTYTTSQLEAIAAQGDVAAALDYATENHTEIKAVAADDVRAAVLLVDHHKDRQIEQLDLERLLPAPRRAKGTTALHTAAGFIEWVKRNAFADSDTGHDVYADLFDFKLVAVLNPSRDNNPGWADHRGVLDARRHPAWQVWRDHNGKFLAQEQFAELVQTRAGDIADPPAMDMLEVAETLTLNVGARISSAVRMRDGQRHLVFDEQIEAKAGYDREVDVPETITLRLPVFEGTDPVEVPCRLLYRQKAGQVGFIVQVLDVVQVERDAFTTLVDGVAGDLATTVLWGKPAAVMVS